MPETPQTWNDVRVELIVGQLLRAGVLLAAAVVLAGGLLFLVRHGREPAGHHVFEGEPEELRTPWGIVVSTVTGHSRGLIQLGLLLLIATPVARVIFSVYAFGRERDWTYVVITLIVLGVLLFSLFGGAAEAARENEEQKTEALSPAERNACRSPT